TQAIFTGKAEEGEELDRSLGRLVSPGCIVNAAAVSFQTICSFRRGVPFQLDPLYRCRYCGTSVSVPARRILYDSLRRAGETGPAEVLPLDRPRSCGSDYYFLCRPEFVEGKARACRGSKPRTRELAAR